MENNILIKKHVWIKTSDDWGERCKHCNNFVGISTGTDGITECNERFNFEKFHDYIEFINFSIIKNNSKIKKYVRRFSDTIKTENQLLNEYFKLHKLNNIQIKTIKTILKNK